MVFFYQTLRDIVNDNLRDTGQLKGYPCTIYVTRAYMRRLSDIRGEWRIYASVNYFNIGSDNGLSPEQSHVSIWTNGVSLLIGSLGTYFNHIYSKYTRLHLIQRIWKWHLRKADHIVSVS